MAPCMIEGVCSKHFPKSFNEFTHEESNGYPNYRRRNDGQHVFIGTNKIDNSWIVPYNLYHIMEP